MDCILCVICWDCYHITLSLYWLSLLHWYFYWCMYFKRAKWCNRTDADGHKTCGTIWHYLDADVCFQNTTRNPRCPINSGRKYFLVEFSTEYFKKTFPPPPTWGGNFCHKNKYFIHKNVHVTSGFWGGNILILLKLLSLVTRNIWKF